MSGMAEVLSKHHADGGYNYDLEWQICTCGTSYAPRTHDTHVAAALTAAGFGPVKEAAAAGVRSIYDVWGAGGRATVRLRELGEVDASILAGDWDSHVKWNMGDIARERARAAAVGGEQ